jgi:hypothetical protein
VVEGAVVEWGRTTALVEESEHALCVTRPGRRQTRRGYPFDVWRWAGLGPEKKRWAEVVEEGKQAAGVELAAAGCRAREEEGQIERVGGFRFSFPVFI